MSKRPLWRGTPLSPVPRNVLLGYLEACELQVADLERQLAESRGKLKHCGQENCMGYRLSDAANWVREERLIEAQGKLEAVEDYEHWQDSHMAADPGYVPACLGPNCPSCKQATDALLDRILSKEGNE